ncbi:MAG: phosphatidylglycerol lysyltransferase domain-containing protein [Pseudomonadota bacterium]
MQADRQSQQIEHSQSEPRQWRRALQGGWGAKALPLAALLVFGGLLARHMIGLDWGAVWSALKSLTMGQVALALVFTAISFRAIGTYDVLVHKVLRTGQSARAARGAGVRAIAISQVLGFGAITSAVLRWYCLPGLGVADAIKLSAVVSLSFMAALAAVTAFVVPISGLVPAAAPWIFGGLAAGAGLIMLGRIAHRMRWIAQPLSYKTLFALLVAAAVDTAFAAAALWILWPDAVSFGVVFAAYLLALGAGLVSNAPGGVGAFDLSLLALLPVTSDAEAMAALLAFRLIYYAVPAALALISLAPPLRPRIVPGAGSPGDHSEATLAHQAAEWRLVDDQPALTLPLFGRHILLRDLPGPTRAPRWTPSHPDMIYKCSARQAAHARKAGWRVLRLSREAILDPQTWTQEGASKRKLRRDIAKFYRQSGLRIAEVGNPELLTTVAHAWEARYDGERGLSVGRFSPDYLRHQRVFAAFDGSAPVAFISFHAGRRWTLDLMRHFNDIPDGTMKALVVHAINVARENGVSHLSLDAVPDFPEDLPAHDYLNREGDGLRRFKSAFDPSWQSLYITAPNVLALAVLGPLLAWRIHHPPALAANAAHLNDEDFSFALPPASCDPLTSFDGASGHGDHPFRPT